jgi:hypothetical protein
VLASRGVRQHAVHVDDQHRPEGRPSGRAGREEADRRRGSVLLRGFSGPGSDLVDHAAVGQGGGVA